MVERLRCALHTYPLAGLMMKAIHMFKLEGLPGDITESLLMLYLYSTGMVGIYHKNGSLHYGYAGYCGDVKEDGTGSRVIVTNFTTVEEMSVEECGIIWLNEFRYPMWETWERYNKLLVELDMSLGCTIVNTRSTVVPVATNDIEKRQYDEMFKAQSQGRRYVPVRHMSNFGKDMPLIDIGYTNGRTPIGELMDARKRVIAEYDNELGIGVFDGIKKERMVTPELNNIMSSSRINVQGMYDTISNGLEDCNRKLGLNLSIEYSDSYKYINVEDVFGSEADDSEGGDNDEQKPVDDK